MNELGDRSQLMREIWVDAAREDLKKSCRANDVEKISRLRLRALTQAFYPISSKSIRKLNRLRQGCRGLLSRAQDSTQVQVRPMTLEYDESGRRRQMKSKYSR